MKTLAIAVLALVLSACSSVTSSPSVRISSADRVAILPMKNLSSTPLAGEQVAVITESTLRSRGVNELATYEAPTDTGLGALLATSSTDSTAIGWARAAGFDYALSGTVHEWHYKVGPDKEPTVALSLRLTDVVNNRVVWQATSAKAGWGFSSLSTVGQKMVNDLLANVRVQ